MNKENMSHMKYNECKYYELAGLRQRIILPLFIQPVFNDISIYSNSKTGSEGFITFISSIFEIGSRKHCTRTVITKSAIIIKIISKCHKFKPVDTGKNKGKPSKRSIILIIFSLFQLQGMIGNIIIYFENFFYNWFYILDFLQVYFFIIKISNFQRQFYCLLVYIIIQNPEKDMIKILPSINSSASLRLLNLNQQLISSSSTQVQRVVPTVIKTKLQLIGKQPINHNCQLFKFKFSGPSFTLSQSQHIHIAQTFPTSKHPQGQQIAKYYSPLITTQNGELHTLIKVYKPMGTYLGGRLGNHINNLKIGQQINVSGPFGKLQYTKPGQIQVAKQYDSRTKKVSNIKKIFFIAAGTGIAPIFQTLQKIVNNPNDKTQVTLLFCNRAEHDIILRKQLQAMTPRIKFVNMLDLPSEGWKGLQGRVNPQVLNQVNALDQTDTYYVSCGPSGFSSVMKKIFEKYPTSKYFKI